MMHIKIIPDNEPNAKGHWITVNLRTERYQKFDALLAMYKKDIPAGHHAVSFTRHTDIKERLS